MKKYLLFILAVALTTTSCSDWLDVRGENIQKEQDQFGKAKGFRDALVGCYMDMSNKDIYGERLTMTDVENLADDWYFDSSFETYEPKQYELSTHQYSLDDARSAIKAIYGNLFTTISSANVLIKNLSEKGADVLSQQERDMIEGEALAIRSYCQLDVLRLFGQVPKAGTKQVSLPYSYTTGIDEMPHYYNYDEYVANLTKDIEKAESLLKDNDPIMRYTFESLNSSNYYGVNSESDVDDFFKFRQSRLNYWAVRALHARMDLYIGNKQEAHDIAMEIINAKGADGGSLMSLSGVKDLHAGYNALPDECLFYLSKYDVNTYANKDLVGGNNVQARDFHYLLTDKMLTDLFASIPGSTASHNRYYYLWNRNLKDPSTKVRPGLKKYWYNESDAASSYLMTKYQIIPMIRLSEMYLIAMETSNSLDEVHSLYATYMKDREYTLYTPFDSLDDARKEMVNEYQREFIGEGQMFYVYKRLDAEKMKWNDKEMTDDDYILPLPSSEYNPDTK